MTAYRTRDLSALVGLTLLSACAHAPATRTVYYACQSGREITVHYQGTDSAVLALRPQTLEMHAADTPLGRRYVSPRLQWLVQPDRELNRATLFTKGYDDEPGDIAEQCVETDRD